MKRGASRLRHAWFFNVRGDLVAGIVVALALIPEAIAFSIIAGVDPKVGLYASFTVAVVIAFAGGRPGMISAATGAMALLMVTLVADHGVEYLFAATILTGVLQMIFSWLKLARYMMFIPRTVMLGFVNSLAVLIFLAQIPHFVGHGLPTYLMVGAGLVILYGFPYVNRTIPPALVALVALTAVAVFLPYPMNLSTVGDMGDLPESLPGFHLPGVPFTLETLWIVLPVAATLTVVGLLESLLTASIVDDLTDTESNDDVEAQGQGIANVVTGFFGGMAGCAMIGQSIINIKSGGLGRLSTLAAGVYLVFFILVLGDLVALIPMPALVAVMIMVAVGTFDWTTFSMLRRMPRTDAFVLLVTMATVVITHDLAKGVFAGVLLSAVFFARKLARQIQVTMEDRDGHRNFRVRGVLFFVAVDNFIAAFHAGPGLASATVDLSRATLWDSSAVGAVDKVVARLRRSGVAVDVVPPEGQGSEMLGKLATYDQPASGGSGH